MQLWALPCSTAGHKAKAKGATVQEEKRDPAEDKVRSNMMHVSMVQHDTPAFHMTTETEAGIALTGHARSLKLMMCPFFALAMQ